MNDPQDTPGLRRLWIAGAWAFVVAAVAGVLFRWGMVSSFPFDLSAPNLRHGHSHLMLMGWATPALMALMARRWPAEGAQKKDGAVAIAGWAAWVLAAASFIPFILWGYDSVSIGTADLPVAAILSGLAIFAWYGFAVIYVVAHRNVRRTPAIRLWDLAVASLVISSVGAWAVAGLMIAGIDSPLWEATTVHFFVDLFGAGWLVLGTLGVLRTRVERRDSTNEKVGRILVGASVAFVFLVGLPRAYVPVLWPVFGSVAAGLMAAGLMLIVQRMWSRIDRWSWRAIVLLCVTIAMLAAVAIPPIAEWGLRSGMRLVYLHVAFAGFVSIGLVAAAYQSWGRFAVGSPTAWLVAILALLATMLPITGMWPSELGGTWTLQVVFIGSVVATVSVGFSCVKALFNRPA